MSKSENLIEIIKKSMNSNIITDIDIDTQSKNDQIVTSINFYNEDIPYFTMGLNIISFNMTPNKEDDNFTTNIHHDLSSYDIFEDTFVLRDRKFEWKKSL